MLNIGKSFELTLKPKKIAQLNRRFRMLPLNGYTQPYFVKETVDQAIREQGISNYGRGMS